MSGAGLQTSRGLNTNGGKDTAPPPSQAVRTSVGGTQATNFDELVYTFTSGAKTLTDEEKLRFLKKSAEGIEDMESEMIRKTIENANKARDRGKAAAERTRTCAPRSGFEPPTARVQKAVLMPTQQGGTLSDAKGHSSPVGSLPAEAGERLTGRPSTTRLAPHSASPVITSLLETNSRTSTSVPNRALLAIPHQVFSAGSEDENAALTPVQMVLGTPTEPLILHDYFPEPVRSRASVPEDKPHAASVPPPLSTPMHTSRRSARVKVRSSSAAVTVCKGRTRHVDALRCASSPSQQFLPLTSFKLNPPSTGGGDDGHTEGRRSHTVSAPVSRRSLTLRSNRTSHANLPVSTQADANRDGAGATDSERAISSLPMTPLPTQSLTPLGFSIRANEVALSPVDAATEAGAVGRTSRGRWTPSQTQRSRSRNASGQTRCRTSPLPQAPPSSAPATSLAPDSDSLSAVAATGEQRRAVLDLLQKEINSLEKASEERKQLEADLKEKQKDEERSRPRPVGDLSCHPEVQHALRLVKGNSSSSFNWLAVAQAMSERNLMPPYCVVVQYQPQDHDEIMEVAMPLHAVERQVSPEESVASSSVNDLQSAWMNMKHILARALSHDNDNKSAWEGLALLLAPGERVVVLRDRTLRPMTVTNIECYIRLLRIEPAFFYGWVGLGSAMREEDELQARQSVGEQSPHPEKDVAVAAAEESGSSAQDKARRGRSGRRNSLSPGSSAASRAAPVSHDVLYGKRPYEAKDCFGRAAMIFPWEPTVWMQLLTAMLARGGGGSEADPVEVDPPCDEQELMAILAQRDALKGVMALTGNHSSGAQLQRSPLGQRGSGLLAGDKKEAMINDMAERLLQADQVSDGSTTSHRNSVFLSVAEVASFALEMNESTADVWRFVGARLLRRKTKRSHAGALAVTTSRSKAVEAAPGDSRSTTAARKKKTAATSRRKTGSGHSFSLALPDATATGNGSPSLSESTRRSVSLSAAVNCSLASITHISVFGQSFSAEACLAKADQLDSRSAPALSKA